MGIFSSIQSHAPSLGGPHPMTGQWRSIKTQTPCPSLEQCWGAIRPSELFLWAAEAFTETATQPNFLTYLILLESLPFTGGHTERVSQGTSCPGNNRLVQSGAWALETHSWVNESALPLARCPVCWGCCNNTDWVVYKQQTLISHSCGGWEVQGHSACRCWSLLRACFLGVHLFAVTSHGRRSEQSLLSVFYKNTDLIHGGSALMI